MFCIRNVSRVDDGSVMSLDYSEADGVSMGTDNPQFSDMDEDEGETVPADEPQDEKLHRQLLKAMKANDVSKVERLLKMRKIRLGIFSGKYLRELYLKVISSKTDCPPWLRHFAIKVKMNFNENSDKSDLIMINIGDLLCQLLPEQYQNRMELGRAYMTSEEVERITQGGRGCAGCCGPLFPEKTSFGCRNLFFWALLCDYQKLALAIFNHGWIESDRPALIGSSLTACKLLNKLADMMGEGILSSQADDLNINARKYKAIANYIMSECFEEDRSKTRQMVLKDRPQWGNESFLVISSYLEGKESESFRIVLHDLWTGKLDDSRYLTLRMLISIIPFFVFIIKVPGVHRFNLFAKWKAFYTSPATKFMFNFISYVFHLFAFSHFLMTDFHHTNWLNISIWEQLVIVWVFGMALEEIRQLTEFGAVGPVQILLNLVDYYISNWNSIDWLMMWTFYVGLVIRFTINENDFYIARIFYCISLILMYFRLLQFATIWEYLGPKVSMIKIMMTRDLPPFLIVFFVFFISFGVAYHALLYPNDILSREMVAQVLAMPYWQLYGELQLEKVEGEGVDGCTHNATLASLNADIPRCPESDKYPWLVPILAGLYMIVSNILLLNLLIAVFNQTYTYVEEESSKVHRFNQYSLVEEYLGRPILPPPLNILEVLIFRPVATLLISCFWCTHKKDYSCRPHCCKLFKLLMVEKEVDPELWERSSAGPRYFKYDQTVKEFIEMKQQELDASAVAANQGAGSQVVQHIGTFQERLQASDKKIEKLQDSIDKIEDRVVKRILEKQREMFTLLLSQSSESQRDEIKTLKRTISSTSQSSQVTPQLTEDIKAELKDIKESAKTAWTKVTNSVKKNRKMLKGILEEREKTQKDT